MAEARVLGQSCPTYDEGTAMSVDPPLHSIGLRESAGRKTYIGIEEKECECLTSSRSCELDLSDEGIVYVRDYLDRIGTVGMQRRRASTPKR